MQIRTIRTKFECKFELFERDSNRSNANSKHSNEIWTNRMKIGSIRKRFEAVKCEFEPFGRDSNHWNANSNHCNDIRRNECWFEQFYRDANHSNANSKHSNEIRSKRMQIWTILQMLTIRMQILSLRTWFEAIKCKFEPFEEILTIRMQIRTIPTT